jgi:CDP-glucose 4,6-dehydratase
MIYKNTFKNKKIIVTGHTGFKGSWLTLWLLKLGAKVVGISINNYTKQEVYKNYKNKNLRHLKLDIAKKNELIKKIKKEKPDFIFHLAAQALVKISYRDPSETFLTNAIGTLNILESARELKKSCNLILITSDKVYKNFEIKRGYVETDILGGDDPYSASKACAELIIKSYIKSFFIKNKLIIVTVARAGNVIGGGDWSKFRLVPDCIKAWKKNKTILIRNPNSTRPWQHVLDAIHGYLTLAHYIEKKNIHGQQFNIGPDNKISSKKVIELVKEIQKNWNNIKWKIEKIKHKEKESNLLKLNSNKAKKILNWKPCLNFQQSIQMVVDWYKNHDTKNKKIFQISINQINKFEELLKKK